MLLRMKNRFPTRLCLVNHENLNQTYGLVTQIIKTRLLSLSTLPTLDGVTLFRGENFSSFCLFTTCETFLDFSLFGALVRPTGTTMFYVSL
jgi:hypothetical protein